MLTMLFFVCAAVNANNIKWISVSVIIVVGLFLLGFFTLLIIRRLWGPGRDRFQPNCSVFTLADLNRMLHENRISQEEYEKLKEKIVAQTRRFP